eukprot:scaffold28430_cov58-Attheya_sp.AAC.2
MSHCSPVKPESQSAGQRSGHSVAERTADPCVHCFLQSTISVAPEQILDTCPPKHKDALKRDLDSAWQASVDTQLRLVAQTLVLAGYDNPRRTYGAKELDLPFRHMLKSMKDRDPAPKPMLALPVETIEAAAAVAFDPRTSRR